MRLMIIDDEYLIRELVMRSIPWAELGFDLVGEAGDGEEALELIPKLAPDLLVVDINMPFMDGITMAAEVRRLYPNIRMILLTGFGEFEYAKQAIKAGVDAYILKPIREDELTEAVVQARSEIMKRRQLDGLESKVKNHSELAREKFLSDWMTEGKYTEAVLAHRLEQFGLAWKGRLLAVGMVEMDQAAMRWPKEEDRQLWSFAVANVSRDLLNESMQGVVFALADRRVSYIVEGGREAALLLGDKITRTVRTLFRFTVTVGISGEVVRPDALPAAWRSAREALLQKFYLGGDRLIEAQESRPFSLEPDQAGLTQTETDGLIQALRLGDADSAAGLLAAAFEKLLHAWAVPEAVYGLCQSAGAAAQAYMRENRLADHDYLEPGYLRRIRELETWAACLERMSELFVLLAGHASQVKTTPAARTIAKAAAYIEEHLTEPGLSLTDVAEALFVNASYLSRIFKQEMQCSLVEYITTRRMKRAKEWMDEAGAVNITMIAERLGYADPYYFSKLFKRHYGIPPSKFIELKQDGRAGE